MARVAVADTDAVIDFFTDSPPLAQVLAGLLQEGRLAVTAITVFELYAGVRGARRLRLLETLFQRVPVFPLDLVAAAHAGKIYTDLKSEGMTVGNQDILIAGICLANDLPLITRKGAHFAPIKGLVLFSEFGV
ncbi:MAG: type II toxin-antitoxin system VapC family toxin [Candidatus Aminicenantales bacterium]